MRTEDQLNYLLMLEVVVTTDKLTGWDHIERGRILGSWRFLLEESCSGELMFLLTLWELGSERVCGALLIPGASLPGSVI